MVSSVPGSGAGGVAPAEREVGRRGDTAEGCWRGGAGRARGGAARGHRRWPAGVAPAGREAGCGNEGQRGGAGRARGGGGLAYSLQSVDSMPNPPAPRDAQAFVTGGAYALLFLLGALEGLVGCFQFSRAVGSFPLAALVLAIAIGATCLLGAAGMGSAAGALAPALGWFAVSVVLSLPTSGGSVIVTGTTAGDTGPGEWYLYGGSACAATAVVLAFVRRSRTRPPRTSMPRRSSFSS